MSETLEKLASAIERGKVDKASPYPPDLKGEIGADELTKQALDELSKAFGVYAKADGNKLVRKLIRAIKYKKELKALLERLNFLHRKVALY